MGSPVAEDARGARHVRSRRAQHDEPERRLQRHDVGGEADQRRTREEADVSERPDRRDALARRDAGERAGCTEDDRDQVGDAEADHREARDGGERMGQGERDAEPERGAGGAVTDDALVPKRATSRSPRNRPAAMVSEKAAKPSAAVALEVPSECSR
jgi:hypothetical protein